MFTCQSALWFDMCSVARLIAGAMYKSLYNAPLVQSHVPNLGRLKCVNNIGLGHFSARDQFFLDLHFGTSISGSQYDCYLIGHSDNVAIRKCLGFPSAPDCGHGQEATPRVFSSIFLSPLHSSFTFVPSPKVSLQFNIYNMATERLNSILSHLRPGNKGAAAMSVATYHPHTSTTQSTEQDKTNHHPARKRILTTSS
jgi:hypothetical protein